MSIESKILFFRINQDTLPHPTGPITQIKSPGWAWNMIFWRENDPFYYNMKIHKIWNEMKNVLTCSHCARCNLHSTLGSFSIDVVVMSILCVDKCPLHSGSSNNRRSLWDSSSKRNAYRKIFFLSQQNSSSKYENRLEFVLRLPNN